MAPRALQLGHARMKLRGVSAAAGSLYVSHTPAGQLPACNDLSGPAQPTWRARARRVGGGEDGGSPRQDRTTPPTCNSAHPAPPHTSRATASYPIARPPCPPSSHLVRVRRVVAPDVAAVAHRAAEVVVAEVAPLAGVVEEEVVADLVEVGRGLLL